MTLSTLQPVHDVIGVGFGPSNLALAIFLQEQAQRTGKPLDALFIERQQHYRWHGDTLASQSELQISFLKDLVSMRNPTSPYSFVNYLNQQGRLVDFINLGTFYPCRMEFNDYLRWVAEQFSEQAAYGEQVLRIEPATGSGAIDTLKVICRAANGREHTRLTRSVVVGTGGTAKIPEQFAAFKDDPRVFHHSRYLSGIRNLPCAQGQPMRIAIIGSGQSAAEAFIDLHDSYPQVRAEMIFRASALKPADSTPFVNEIFAPAATDLMFGHSEQARRQLLEEYQNTNYSVVDAELISRIYGVLYRQKVARQQRHAVLCRQQVEHAQGDAEGISLTLRDLNSGEQRSERYDAVVLATGYERNTHRDLLAPLHGLLQDCQVDREYRALAAPALKAPIFLQGFCEDSHGLSDTLLSVLPIRSAEIGQALQRALGRSAAPSEAPDRVALASA